ncbi:hypothetical protein B0H13DRAFT_1858913 [Mycena leptocephala]|nr:hypothetical protein B0H13DRAFT_1858913 [Mycena leptocephala]
MRFESQSHQLPLVMESELDSGSLSGEFSVQRVLPKATLCQGADGLPIRSPTPYSFADSLLNQNEIVIQREDFDPVYRGDDSSSRRARSCFLRPQRHGNVGRFRIRRKENIPPGTLLLPEELSDTNMSDVSDSDDGESEIDELESSPAPAERLGSPFTPQRRTNTYANRMVTYDRRDRERVHAERAALATERLALEQVIAATLHAVPFAFSSESMCDSAARAVSFTLGLMSAPKGEESWWADIIKQAFKDLDHLRRHGDFSDIRAGEIQLRLGVTFGEEDAARCPMVSGTRRYLAEAKYIEEVTVSMQFGLSKPHVRAHRCTRLCQSRGRRRRAHRARDRLPSFEHSVFTTTEIDFGNVSYLSIKTSMLPLTPSNCSRCWLLESQSRRWH